MMILINKNSDRLYSEPLWPQVFRHTWGLAYHGWLFKVSCIIVWNNNKQVQLLLWHTLISNFSSARKMFFYPLMSHNVDCLLPHWVVSLTLCGPLHLLRPSTKPGWNEGEKQAQFWRPSITFYHNLAITWINLMS